MFGFGLNQSHELFIMQSAENKDNVIEAMKYLKSSFEDIYDNNATDLILDALDRCRLSKEDFTDEDWREIQRASLRIA